MRTLAASALATLLLAGLATADAPLQAATITLQPGQSWDVACNAAQPGDVIQLAAGTWPSQSCPASKLRLV